MAYQNPNFNKEEYWKKRNQVKVYKHTGRPPVSLYQLGR